MIDHVLWFLVIFEELNLSFPARSFPSFSRRVWSESAGFFLLVQINGDAAVFYFIS